MQILVEKAALNLPTEGITAVTANDIARHNSKHFLFINSVRKRPYEVDILITPFH